MAPMSKSVVFVPVRLLRVGACESFPFGQGDNINSVGMAEADKGM